MLMTVWQSGVLKPKDKAMEKGKRKLFMDFIESYNYMRSENVRKV
jgi:hypothetical protein